MKKTATGAILLIAASTALAFNVDGFRSGMTPAEVAATAQQQGAEMWQIGATNYATGQRSQQRLDGTFSFCPATGLIAYSTDLDAENGYLPAVERALTAWGQPTVSLRHTRWLGQGGGDISLIEMKWKQPHGTEVAISSNPDGRDGSGALRYKRSASISYLDRSRVCHSK